jgi:hypothetical protein
MEEQKTEYRKITLKIFVPAVTTFSRESNDTMIDGCLSEEHKASGSGTSGYLAIPEVGG